MTFRSDVTVDWRQSPRLIFIAAPSTEISIQDLHDTLRVLEERPGEGLPYPSIVETAGKEELGDGVNVGLTMKLLNARLAFQGRKTSVEIGTVTTADTTGYRLTDSNATFVTNGVQPGAWIINLTDGSRATVLRVVSQTVLETDVLGDGVDNQFGSGDSYEVQNVTQVEINGGNLVAVASDLVTPLDPVLPTMGTQVVRTASSSATQVTVGGIDQATVQAAMTAQGYTTSRAPKIDNLDVAISTVKDAVWSKVVDGTITAEQSIRLMNAILGSKVSGAGTGTETFRNPDDNKDRVVTTVDSEGNRTAIVRDLS